MPSAKRGPKDKLLAKNALALQNTHTLAANLHIALLFTLVSMFYGGYALSPAGTTELPLYVVTADNPVRAGGPPYPLSSVRSVRVSTVQTLQLPSLLGAIFLLSSAEHAFYASTCRSYYRGFLHARVNPVRWAVQASALPLAASVHVYFCLGTGQRAAKRLLAQWQKRPSADRLAQGDEGRLQRLGSCRHLGRLGSLLDRWPGSSGLSRSGAHCHSLDRAAWLPAEREERRLTSLQVAVASLPLWWALCRSGRGLGAGLTDSRLGARQGDVHGTLPHTVPARGLGLVPRNLDNRCAGRQRQHHSAIGKQPSAS